MRDTSDRTGREIYIYIQHVLPKIVPFMRYVEKYGTTRQATDDNMAHALCVLDN